MHAALSTGHPRVRYWRTCVVVRRPAEGVPPWPRQRPRPQLVLDPVATEAGVPPWRPRARRVGFQDSAMAFRALAGGQADTPGCVAIRKAFVILDGTLLRIDRVGMGSGRHRPYSSGKNKAHGENVQVIADPAGRLVWASPALPGARHDMDAARELGILEAPTAAGVRVIADNGYRGAGFEVPQRRRPADPQTGQRRRLSRNQKAVNSAHARQRGPG